MKTKTVDCGTPGDIIKYQGIEYVILGRKEVAGRVWDHYKVIPLSKVNEALKSPSSIKVIYWRIRNHLTFTTYGKLYPKAKIEKLKKLFNEKKEELVTKRTAVKKSMFEKNSPKIDWEGRNYCVKMVDKATAKVGDSVMVRFSNGDFVGRIKAIGGRDDGRIMISFFGRVKSKAISPSRILRKV